MVSPDLLITVNFTALGVSAESLVDARQSAVSILVGLTNNTADIVENTIPTPLFPGSHLCGSTSRELRRRFVKPPLASLGFFSVSDIGFEFYDDEILRGYFSDFQNVSGQ